MTDRELLQEEVQVDVTNQLLAGEQESRLEPNCITCDDPGCWGDWTHYE